jgi:hypothetical protein
MAINNEELLEDLDADMAKLVNSFTRLRVKAHEAGKIFRACADRCDDIEQKLGRMSGETPSEKIGNFTVEKVDQ